MRGEATARSGLASPAEAARLVGEGYRLAPEEARKLVVEGLRSGEVNAVIISVYGERRLATAADFSDAKLDFEIPPEPMTIPAPLEGEAEAVPALVAEAGEPGFSLGILRIVNPRLEINLLSLWRYAKAILGGSQEGAEAARAKNRGGRPTSHDWKRAMRQVLLRVRDYGWPATRAELAAELLDWFSCNFEEAPDESTVRRFVSDIWPQGPCELRSRE